MSLYRQVRRRNWPLVALTAVLGIGVGVVTGLLIGGGDSREPLSSAVERIQDELAPAIDGLELLSIEYKQAVKNGRVVAPTELDAASRDLKRVRQSYDGVAPDLAVLDANAARAAGDVLDRLNVLVDRHAPPDQVDAAAKTAITQLKLAARL